MANPVRSKILIVEDDPGIITFLKTTLAADGYDALLASTGRLALDMAASHCPDCILLDLPPVTAVTDALVATKMVDGIIMVVRNEHADSGSLKEAMRQLKLVDAKILGFVYTCAGSSAGGYRGYRKYYKKYKYRYYNDYERKK